MPNFTPPNYESHPDGTHTLDGNGRVQCDCGKRVWPFVLIEVKQFDNVNQDWACDGCWTTWRRTRKPMYNGDNPEELWDANHEKSRKAWDEQWLKGHKAPQDIIDRMKQTKRRA